MDTTVYYNQPNNKDFKISISFDSSINLSRFSRESYRKSRSSEFASIFIIILLFSISGFLLWSTDYGLWKLKYNRIVSYITKAPETGVEYLVHNFESEDLNQDASNTYLDISKSSFRPITIVNPQIDVSAVFIYHTISPGETLWKIAKEFNQDITMIVGLNPQIKNPDLIFPGMKIKIATR